MEAAKADWGWARWEFLLFFLCAVEAQQRWCYKYFANVWHFCQSGRWIPTESGDLICGIESGDKIFKILRVRIRWSVYGAVKSEAPLWQLWQILNILRKIRALWQLWQSLQKSNFPWNKATLGQNSKKEQRQNKYSRKKTGYTKRTCKEFAWICWGKTYTALAIRSYTSAPREKRQPHTSPVGKVKMEHQLNKNRVNNALEFVIFVMGWGS